MKNSEYIFIYIYSFILNWIHLVDKSKVIFFFKFIEIKFEEWKNFQHWSNRVLKFFSDK